MPDYAFYTGTYLGEDIPEADFARYAARAQRKLARMRQLYRVTPRPDQPNAEENAICAIADTMFEFDGEDARRGVASAAVGSVSESYAAPPELCPATLYLRERFFRQVAEDFLQIERGVRHA